ncbi:hypothetical protein JVU11DRAFT_6655 [Chiua virens]|nr:hypothetical protein JVU11DRAFT_6655 [Chiua virens]
MHVSDIPLDILLDILAHLPLQAVLVLRRTCKHFYAVTHLRSLWTLLFREHVLDQCIPFPRDTDGLESLTRRALALRRTWTSPSPVPRRQLTFSAPEQSARVIFIQFLPARSNRWLISVRMTVHPRSYLLQCWDVASATCVAELRHADGPYGGVVLNSDPNSPAALAMQSAQTETFSIRFDADDPESAFETEATIDGIRELHLLSGSTLVTRQIDDGGALSLWDLTDLSQEKLLLLNPSLTQPDDRVQAIHIAHDYALVLRIQSIELYNTTPRLNILPVPGAPIAYPLAQFKFQWSTDTIVLSEQHAISPSPSPIHFFVRFGSIYPWPVNVLHHYVLRPNPSWGHARTHGTSTPLETRPPPVPTTEYNLPYDLRPYPTHTISSPVRLFSQSAIALGRYGTALWLDNHTEDLLGPSEHGQRLAAMMLHGANVSNAVASEGGTTPDPPGTEPIVNTNWSNASTVFGVRDDEVWTRIAMEEETGGIALGHTDGAITYLEY